MLHVVCSMAQVANLGHLAPFDVGPPSSPAQVDDGEKF